MAKTRKCPLLLLCLGLVAGGWGAIVPAEEEPPASDRAEAREPEIIPPQIIIKTQKAPEYPPAAFQARFGGQVTLEVKVLEDGKVADDVRVVECTHKKVGFEEAAIEAVKQWRFEPATADGEPVEFTKTFRLTFHGRGAGAEVGPYVTTGSEPMPESGRAATTPNRETTATPQRKR